jgi:hypothetical protein
LINFYVLREDVVNKDSIIHSSTSRLIYVATTSHGRTQTMSMLTITAMSLMLPLLSASDPQDRPSLALELKHGICIDRQFRTIPPEPCMRIEADDIRLIKSMGFEFVKFLVNPEPLMSNGHLDASKKWVIRNLAKLAVDEELPAVVCIHPEWEYKKKVLGSPEEFEKYCAFLEDVARFLAEDWSPKQVALQLMTEPGGVEMNWNELQPKLWRAARRAMPSHTLILAGDQVGKIEGLISTEPVDDANVLYSFTTYDPFVFTLQGGEWLTPELWSHLARIPYPSSPEIIAEQKQSILDQIPAEHPDWRAAAEGMLTEYGEARWNKEKIKDRINKLVDWNNAHGGNLRIWCAEFGCYQRTVKPEDRTRFMQDLREAFEDAGIGWAYWSYNENFSIMTSEHQPFGPAKDQRPDEDMLNALLGDKK